MKVTPYRTADKRLQNFIRKVFQKELFSYIQLFLNSLVDGIVNQ